MIFLLGHDCLTVQAKNAQTMYVYSYHHITPVEDG